MRILAVGGGSGGHVSPVVAVLNELAKQLGDTSLEAQFVCDKTFEVQSRKLMEGVQVPVKIHVIAAGKLRRYEHFKKIDYLKHPSIIGANLLDVAKIVGGFLQSVWLLVKWRPNVVFAKGGYVCLPVGFAAWLLHVPVVIHDSDVKPGLTNRLLARFARAIATGYPLDNYHYPAAKSTYTGVPVAEGYTLVSAEEQSKFKQKLGFSESELLVVAVGGGLGAVTINNAMTKAGSALTRQAINVVLVAGQSHLEEYAPKVADLAPRFKVVGFVSEGMSELLGAADVVVTRASATVLQELAGLGKSIIAIPARALGDQHKNAVVYEEAKAAVILTDDQLNDGSLEPTVLHLANNSSYRDELAHNLHQFAKPRAAVDVAAILRRIGLPGIRK